MDKLVTIGQEFRVFAKINKTMLIFSVASTEICALTHGDSIYNCWSGLEVVILHETDKKITENIAVKKYLVLPFYPITETY